MVDGLKIGDKVNFQHDNGVWSEEIFTITGFITDEQMEAELKKEHYFTLLLGNGKEQRVTEKAYKSKEEVRNVYLDWDCYWFPEQEKRLRIAEGEKCLTLRQQSQAENKNNKQ